jgi:hypothetical protein
MFSILLLAVSAFALAMLRAATQASLSLAEKPSVRNFVSKACNDAISCLNEPPEGHEDNKPYNPAWDGGNSAADAVRTAAIRAALKKTLITERPERIWQAPYVKKQESTFTDEELRRMGMPALMNVDEEGFPEADNPGWN